MRNCTEDFNEVFKPFKGILIHINQQNPMGDAYVETFDLSPDRTPINFHPFSENESALFLETLSAAGQTKPFLHLDGLIPENILSMKLIGAGGAIWYTPPKLQTLDFKAHKIPSGQAYIPSLIWKASRKQLLLFAVRGTKRPTLDTPLCYAPFFNVDASGLVCMGTVEINIPETASLQEFVQTWEDYFFKSAFTSQLYGFSPVTGALDKFWKRQIKENAKFPTKVLRQTTLKLKDIV
ncbi:hypothetical protein [Puia dinghuensis]|uniref:PRTRC system protein B n=1 Tax=Puia dinghuensis TaxID=1792502 RepID=A0A8J2UB40_9BACT|nr:hypothetical protein [Puia dinghuensis]GGA92722.1 hypothetical protein GCM10011511_15140 [Puia dinghuensis]